MGKIDKTKEWTDYLSNKHQKFDVILIVCARSFDLFPLLEVILYRLLSFGGMLAVWSREVSASQRFQMYYFYGKSNWGHGICPLYRGCPPFGESVIRGFTVLALLDLHYNGNSHAVHAVYVLYSLPVDARKYLHLLGNGCYVLYVWGLIICMTFEHMDKTR